MQRLLWQGTLGVLGILGLSLGPGAALADAGDDFLAARDAFRSGDQPRVAQYAQRLRGHPLQPYVQAWDLTMRLDRADPGEIRAFLNTQGDSFAGDRLRADWPELKIYARARDAEHARLLLERGATHVVPETVEASLQLAERVLEDMGLPQETADGLIDAQRAEILAALESAPGKPAPPAS